MIADAVKTETVDEIVVVRGTHEATSDVDVADIKETAAQLLRKAKTEPVTEAVQTPTSTTTPNAANHDRSPIARVALDNKWTVVKRRTDQSMGKRKMW